MSRHVVITNGDDPLTKPIMDYLDSLYGIDPADVRAVELRSEVGAPQLITVTLMVRNPIALTEVQVPFSRTGETLCDGVWPSA